MQGFVKDIDKITKKNTDFRRVLYTARNSQLVVMSLLPSEEIGEEIHHLDQFFRVEEGVGEMTIEDVRSSISSGFAMLVPAGARHNLINNGTTPLKLYTLYSPPNHRDGIVHHTKDEAMNDNEQFDGRLTP